MLKLFASSNKVESKKNPLFLADAAKTFPGIHFIIAGNGELEAIIRDQIGDTENITLLPFQNQSKMPVVYRLTDVFVLPSKGPGETWGLAINEAMASGRMVVATNKCGGAIDLIKTGENGFVINPDKRDFLDILNWIQTSPGKIDLFKKNSKTLIKEFNLKKLSATIEELVIKTAC